jgi:hypothetical protein
VQLTRREKHVLIIAAIIAIFFVITRPSYETVQAWEWFYLVFVVGPVGLYIALDPERKKEG